MHKQADKSARDLVAKLGIVDAAREARRLQAMRPSAIGAARVALLDDPDWLARVASL